MLKIFNDLEQFFLDCYRRIHVREYGRIIKISTPTASKTLEYYYKKGLIKKETEHQFIYYLANRENQLFIDLSRIYWRIKIEESGFLDSIKKTSYKPVVILFGSLAKAEVTPKSDIDVAVFNNDMKIDTGRFEKRLKRKMQLFVYNSRNDVKNKGLLKNIDNGFRLLGDW